MKCSEREWAKGDIYNVEVNEMTWFSLCEELAHACTPGPAKQVLPLITLVLRLL